MSGRERPPCPLPAPSWLTTVRAMGNLRAKSVDFLLAISSRRNSLGQEAPDLTFDGTLIDDMSCQTPPSKDSVAMRVTSATVVKRTFLS